MKEVDRQGQAQHDDADEGSDCVHIPSENTEVNMKNKGKPLNAGCGSEWGIAK